MPKAPKRTHATLPLEIRLLMRLEMTNGCWLWHGSKDKKGGYGMINVGDKKLKKVHRVAYQLIKGEIPKGLDLDHLCRVRNCANPDHLEPVTRRENIMRGINFMAGFARRTHCNRGHAFDKGNTVLRQNGGRRCKICRNAQSAERKRKFRKLRKLEKLNKTI